MRTSILEDDASESARRDDAELSERKMFYYGADFVLEALAEKPEEIDLIREEIRQHLKRLEDAATS
jgi:chlorite dismutase